MGRWDEPVIDRFLKQVEKTETCWKWTGYTDAAGYGVSGRVPGTKSTPERAHRRSWRLHIGPLPEGTLLHHACRNKTCVNPDHLIPMTQTDHGLHHHSRATQCIRGHAYPENARINKHGHIQCRVCDADRKRRSRREQGDAYRAYERARKRRNVVI